MVYGSRSASCKGKALGAVCGKRRRRTAARTVSNARRIFARALKPPDFIACHDAGNSIMFKRLNYILHFFYVGQKFIPNKLCKRTSFQSAKIYTFRKVLSLRTKPKAPISFNMYTLFKLKNF